MQSSPLPIVGIAIGTGTPTEAAEAGARYGSAITCLADIDQSIYRAYAVGRAPLQAFTHWSVLRDGVAALRDGHGMGSSHGDVMQMPATFVIDAHGIIRHAGYAQTISEFPPESVLRNALTISS